MFSAVNLSNNMLGWLIATFYVLAIIGLSEGLRRWRGWGSDLTRKVVHIGVGMLIWAVPFLFESPTPFIITALFFAAITLLDHRYHFFPAMMSKDNENTLGTFYFPLVAALATWLFWDRPALLVASLMPLVWGDGMAELIGRNFGRNPYTIFNHTRTFEGSAAFVLFSFTATLLALTQLPHPTPITLASALLPALFLSVTTAVIEAFSPNGSDNVTVTIAAIALFSVWPF